MGFFKVYELNHDVIRALDLFHAEQAFDRFLAGDGCADASEALQVDQAVDLVAGCELAFYSLLVSRVRPGRFPVTPV